ncbi:MAG: beta-ketoacyl-ACP synthase 3 [Acidobacteriota bacterium]
MPHAQIGYLGFGSYLPPTIVTNDELASIVDTSDDWIRRRTGIQTRRVLARDETILDMAVKAAERALDDAGIRAEDLDDIRVGVVTWCRFPSLATQVQRAIGAHRASAADVSAGCAGFIYAVEEAYNRLFIAHQRGGHRGHALVIGVDGLSHITNWRDRGTCVLLGDGAGAVVIGPSTENQILAIHTRAAGHHGDLLYSNAPLVNQKTNDAAVLFSHHELGPRSYLHMDGPKVFPIAVRTMVEDVHRVIESHNRWSDDLVSLDDVRYVFPHQANLRIIESVAKRLGVPLDFVYTTGVRDYGNTSSASIPIGYVDQREHQRGRGDIEVDVAFGAGFASGAILRRIAA